LNNHWIFGGIGKALGGIGKQIGGQLLNTIKQDGQQLLGQVENAGANLLNAGAAALGNKIGQLEGKAAQFIGKLGGNNGALQPGPPRPPPMPMGPPPEDPLIVKARLRLRKHVEEALKLEDELEKQDQEWDSLKGVSNVGETDSSGNDYWTANMNVLRQSAPVTVPDAAEELSRHDSKCVICQYIVQQAINNSGFKKPADEDGSAASFVEMDSTAATLSSSHSSSHSQIHSSRPRSSFTGTAPRHFPTRTLPDFLNDFGYEENHRQRQADSLDFRPRTARFSKDPETEKAKWDQARTQYKTLSTSVYNSMEHLCNKRMPMAYLGYCREVLTDFRYIAQGIQYGDKAASICMNGNWCAADSYIRNQVHTFFVRKEGDF